MTGRIRICARRGVGLLRASGQVQCFLCVFVYDISLPRRVSQKEDPMQGYRGRRELTIETAGTTLSRFGVNPLNNPRKPSPWIVCRVTSNTPVYVRGCEVVP